MLHRFKETLPAWICSAAGRLRDEYGGDASHIWPPGTPRAEVTERLSAFDGIGRKKAVMAAEILVRHFGVELAEQAVRAGRLRRARAPRLPARGLADADSLEAIEAAAASRLRTRRARSTCRRGSSGGSTCRPRAPRCDECRLAGVCPRLADRHVGGVGARQGA